MRMKGKTAFVLLAAGAAYFFLRSLKDGYLGQDSEEPKYRMLRDDNEQEPTHDADASRRLL